VAKHLVQASNTSRSEYIFIQNSSSTTGAGLTGLVFNTASLTAYYVVERGAATAITLVTLASSTAAFASGGFIAVDGTNMPGLYRFDVPNALFSVASTDKVTVMLKGATNMAPVLLEYQIVAFNPDDTVRLGLTAIPNVAQGTTGAISTGDASGRVTVITNSDKTAYSLSGTQTFNVTGNITGNVTGSVGSVASGGITSASFAAGAIDASAIATDAITSAELSASAVQEIADGVLSRKLNMAGNISDVSVTSVSSATFTGANTYIAGDAVQFITTAPTSFALATKYYVIATSLTATTFQLSATSGGSAITTVSTGAFTVLPIDDRTVRSALRYVRNKVGISGSTMTVSIEDDATSAWTAALTTSPGVDPVTTLDPA
jgi:hypothetical protein